ncbi:MAG: SLC13 family permease, partial [Lysobacterales bacterium]
MDGTISLSPEMLLVLALAGFAMVMFSLEWMRTDVTALIVLVALGITGLVPIDRLFDGFAGNAVMAILATMILGAGLDRTGVLSLAAGWLLKASRGHEKRLMLLLCAMSGGVSAFMQNPAVAALFVPVAARLSNRTGLPLARLLLPMASCIMLGGTITMVGNSPQILLNDLIDSVNRNLPPGAAALHTVAPFAIAPIGLVLLAAGLVYFWFFADRLLPRDDEGAGATPARTETYFANAYGIEGDVFETTVTADSPLVGQSIAEFEATPGAPVLLALKTGEDARLSPPGDQMIWVGSVLGVMGARDTIHAWAEENALRVSPRLRNFGDMFNPARAGI